MPLALERQPEDAADYFGLLGDDLRLQPVQTVAVGHGGWGEDPFLHPHFDAEPHVAGVAGGLHLGEGGIDRGCLLRAEPAGVDVLLFEADGDAQPHQLPHEVQGIPGVAGESGDGLDQDAVDFPGPAVRHHAVELISFLGVQTRNALIGIDVGQLPVRVFSDVAGVVVHLGQIGVELVRRVAADAGVGGHAELGFFRCGGVDYGDFWGFDLICHVWLPPFSNDNTTTLITKLLGNSNEKQG